MFSARRFIHLRTRRARRGGALLLIALWTMLWVSQAYAACCGPHGGAHPQPLNPAMAMHAIVQTEHEECIDPQAPCCTQVLDEKVPVASMQPGIVDDGRPVQLALIERSLPLLFEVHRTGNVRIPDSPGPPDRVYLRLQRLLI